MLSMPQIILIWTGLFVPNDKENHSHQTAETTSSFMVHKSDLFNACLNYNVAIFWKYDTMTKLADLNNETSEQILDFDVVLLPVDLSMTYNTIHDLYVTVTTACVHVWRSVQCQVFA